METKTRSIARAVKVITGRGNQVFNDCLSDGTRSLKVWGWTRKEYAQAKQLLEQAGCEVEIVEFRSRAYGNGSKKMQVRLHVKE